MRRLVYILTMTLMVAFYTAAGQSYVIDKVCLGAKRTYRIEGEKGSTWLWKLQNAGGIQIMLADSTGTRFADINSSGDSIWGSEVKIDWTVLPGIYDLSTAQTSSFGCVNHELGQIEVVPAATVNAGANIFACYGNPVPINNAIANNYSNLLWSTSGDGTFNNSTTLKPIYTPGTNDLTLGSVNLTLTANGQGNAGSCVAATSITTITFSSPKIQLTTNNLLCNSDSTGSISAIVSGGIEPYILAWTGPNGFIATGKNITGLTAGQYTVLVSDSLGCTATQTVNITQPEKLILTETHVDVGYFAYKPIGSINLSVTGGTGPYSYLWSNGKTVEDLDSLYKGTYSVIVTDANGCQDSLTVTITALIPYVTMSCPSGTIVQCKLDIPPPYTGYNKFKTDGGSAYSDCVIDSTTFRFVSDSTDGFTCAETIFRTYELSDYCGNITSCTQIIVILDTIPPAITCPAPLVVQCTADVPAPDTSLVSASDNCGAVVVEWISDISDKKSCPETIRRTYRATDKCHNTSECVQTIIINDTIPPAITCPAPFVVQCAADVPAPDTSLVSASDNCGAVVVMWVSDKPDSSLCPVTISRTYRATDKCNNSSDCVQIITIKDTIPPTITCPAPIVAQCNADVPAPDTTQILASDNCGAVIVKWISDVSDNKSCPETITRTYRVTDKCNNSVECIQTIVIKDIIPPAITCPAPIVAQCAADVPAPDTTLISASDNCGAVIVRWISDVSDNNSCPETITRTYRATDKCNNSVECKQTIVIKDTIKPTITSPAPIFAQCAADVPAPDTSLISASDNCGAVVVAFISDVSDGKKCPEIIARTYRVTDNCGNYTNVEQTIIINDTIKPTITCPAPIVAQCTADVPAPDTSLIFASDNCGAVTVAFISDVSDGKSCPETIIRTYRAIDKCGNWVECNLPITIKDTIAPIITCPAPQVVTCSISEQPPYNNYSAFIAAGGFASDNCGINQSSFKHLTDVSNGVTCPQVIIRTYQIADLCGNTSIYTQSILVNDTIKPVMTCPAPIAAICGNSEQPPYANYAAYFAAGGLATDNCGIDQSSFILVSEVSSGTSCPEIITRTYQIADLCGNKTTCTQTFTVDDAIKPVITCPAPDTAICSISELPAYTGYDEFIAAGGIVHDSCGINKNTFRHVGDVIDGKKCPETIIRTYEVADLCGNISQCTQTIIVSDTIKPMLNCPVLLAAVCDISELPPFKNYTEFTVAGGYASDNCSIDLATFKHSGDSSDGKTCPETIIRTYEIADLCGNKAICSQLIIINDTIKPTITCPATLYVECAADVPAPDTSAVLATDNCGAVVVRFVSDISKNNPCLDTITRTYKATDRCGNMVFCSQMIIINDTIRPTADPMPEIGPFACYSEIPAPNPNDVVGEKDNCKGPVTIAHIGDSADPGCEGLVFRTYRLVDGCSNTSEIVQIIHIRDTIPPVADTLPVLGPFACFADIPVPDSSSIKGIRDNCSDSVSVRFGGDSAGSGCSGNVTRTYILKDECNNITVLRQLIIINDTVPPVADTLPDLGPYACYAEIPAYNINTVTGMADNCSGNVKVSYVGDSGDPGCEGTVIRTYRLTDDCNNSADVHQRIFIHDTIPPVAETLPTIGPFECYEVIPAANINDVTGKADNCGKPVIVTFKGDTPNPGCAGIILRTYQVADSCGNSINIVQRILVNDTIPPTANPLPVLGTFACYDEIPLPDLNLITGESDNCSDTVYVSYVGDSPDPGCEGTVKRTYRISDICNNSKDITQEIFIHDTIPPVANPLADMGPFACYSEIPSPNISLVTGSSDNCSDSVRVEFVSDTDNPGCQGTVTRTYRIYDVCNNSIDVKQLIHIKDTIAPIANPLPALGPFQCYSDKPAANTEDVTGETDNCGQPVIVTFVSDTNDPGCTGMVTRTYKLEDICGNSSLLFQTITIKDTIGPVYVKKPNDFTITCAVSKPYGNYAEFVNAGGLIADNCHLDTASFKFINDVTSAGNCPRLVQRTYRISDLCGNSTDYIQNITIVDTIPPVIICPPYMNVFPFMITPNKYETYSQFITARGFISDNCEVDTSSFKLVKEVSDGRVNPENVVRTYQIKDMCGNISTCEHTLHIFSGFDLVVICPNDLFLNCTDPIPAPFANYSQFIAGGGFASSSICPVDTSSFHVVDYFETNACPKIIKHIYEISDTCGNSERCEHIITINDVVPPTLQCPPTTVIPAGLPLIPAFTDLYSLELAGGSSFDNCKLDRNSFRLISEVSDKKLYPETILRSYEISDWCGNKDTCTHTIKYTHTTTITIACPDTLIATCYGQVPGVFPNYTAFVNAGGLASSDCGIKTSTFRLVSETATHNICPDTLYRTYEIADSCGTVASCTFIAIVHDTVPPVLNCPPEISITSAAPVPLPLITWATFTDKGGSATDNCAIDQNSLRLISEVSDHQLFPETITRIYEIADLCGNVTTCTQRIKVLHDANLSLFCPPAINIECRDSIPLPFANFSAYIAAGGNAVSGCGIDVSTFKFIADSTDGKHCPETLYRKYQIADSCGNYLVCWQAIVINDITPPELVCPPDTVLPFNSPLPAEFTTLKEFINAGGKADDNCELDENSFRLLLQDTVVYGQPTVIRRTYEIADLCGNPATCERLFTVLGNANVQMICPKNINIECLGDIPASYYDYAAFRNGGGAAFSDCGINANTFMLASQTTNGLKCPETITRVYTISDSCGTVLTCNQLIIVKDITPPSLVCPGDKVVKTIADKPAPYSSLNQLINAGGAASDNCGLVSSTFRLVSETSNGKKDPEMLTRIYEIADSCGNTAICNQLISIIGNAKLQISCPPNITVDCIDKVPRAYTTLNAFRSAGGNAVSSCNIVSFTYKETSSGKTCPEVISRTYEVTDDCGNKESCTQSIIINDTNAPTLLFAPNMITTDCHIPQPYANYSEFVSAGGRFRDNCGVNESSFSYNQQITDRISSCHRIIYRFYSITDYCGNKAYYTQTIEVDDNIPPVFDTVPGTINSVCDVPQPYANYNAFATAGGRASDNCFLSTSSFKFVKDQVTGNCPKIINRTYQIADSCGLVSQFIQRIIVNDTIRPQFTCMKDTMIKIGETLPPVLNTYNSFIANGGKAFDNCGLNTASFRLVSDSVTSPSCPKIITRTYEIADLCGNITRCSYNITILEHDLPVITCPPDDTLECIADLPASFKTYEEFVAGGGSLSNEVRMDLASFRLEKEVSDGKKCPEIITRIYSIADSCSNKVTCSQVFVINDKIPPVMVSSDTMKVYPGQPIPGVYTNFFEFVADGGQITDNCTLDTTSFALMSQSTLIKGAYEYVIRTYRILDLCKNSASSIHVIRKTMFANMTMNCPDTIKVSCISEIPPAFKTLNEYLTAGGIAISNCDINPSSFKFVKEVINSPSCPLRITRTYEVSDFCGNTQTCQHVLIADDKIAPVINCPETMFVQCHSEIPLPDSTTVKATDNCGPVTVRFVKDSTDNRTCPETITRTYKAVDVCGNTSLCRQLIIVRDTIAPVITLCPPDLAVVCVEDVPRPDSTQIRVTDNCGKVTVRFVSDISDNKTCPETITRTYEAKDNCGNISLCRQLITVNDFIPPQMTCFNDTIVASTIDIPKIVISLDTFIAWGGKVFDNCRIDKNSFRFVAENRIENPCSYSIQRVYEIADACGNLARCINNITVMADVIPFIKSPGDKFFACKENVPGFYKRLNQFTDDGGTTSDIVKLDVNSFRLVSEISDGKTCPETIVRKYEIADFCGDTVSFIQRIVVNDTIPPEFLSVPKNINTSCDLPGIYGDYSSFIYNGGVADDNCSLDEASFHFVKDSVINASCPKEIRRTYQISDYCGNKAKFIQTIVINDTIAPVFTSVPKNIEGECSTVESYKNYSEFVAAGGNTSDNCRIDTSSFVLANIVVISQSCPSIVSRTYHISDICGNPVEFTQQVIMNDLTGPVFVSVPDDIYSFCSPPQAYPDYASFVNAGGNISDNCGFDETSFTLLSEKIKDQNCPRTITRTYQIEDVCGNKTTYDQKIVINDTIPPVVIKTPDDVTVECNLPMAFKDYKSYTAAGGLVTDNCGLDEMSFKLASELRSGKCPTVITRMYQISDSCGNVVSLLHTILSFDNTLPQIVCPSEIHIQPNESMPKPYSSVSEFINAGGLITDNCGFDSRTFVLLSEISDKKSCPETRVRTYEISDSCNNKASCSQNIIIWDTIAPVILNPNHIVVECMDAVPKVYKTVAEFLDAGGKITDNYRIDETSFRLVSEVDDGKRCPKLLTRTYSISDSCGNTSTCFQYVTVSDLTEPVLDCPASASVNCYSDVPPPFASLAAFVASGGSVSDNCGYIEDSFKLFSEKISTGKPKVLTRIYQIADSCNNIGSCAQRFTVLDSIAPVAICNEVEISLDSIGNMTLRRIDLQTIGSGSFDNCTAFPNLAFDIVPNRINCSNIGTPVTVVLTVTDEVGNQSTCSTNILVKDTTAPKANCRDLTVYLDDRGNIGISKEMINNNSFDNCGIRSMFIDRNKFDCNTVGVNNVLLSVVDNYANISTCTSKVTVLDTIPPEVECRDIVLNLRGDETVMITPSDLNAGSTDACGIDSMWVSKNRFTCANVGNNAVILYARDENGNISSCTANVRINGNKAPVAVDDRRFTVVNTPATVNILANDYDPNGKIDTTSLAYLNKFQHGKMVIGEKAGEIYYIPETDFIGYDTLFYVICDDGIPCGSLCDTAKLVFIITPPNVAPIAVDDSFKIGCRNITESFILNDYDPDGNEIIASIMPVVKPLHGTVNINTDGTFTYSHDFGFIGIDSFRYEICDNGMHQLCDTATVKISILIDTDCDGIPNIDDIDDDDDGILDVIEGDGSIDTDSDGVPDSLDIDSDNDGIVDNIEGQGEKPGNYIFPKGADCNGNGWDDAYDPGCSGTPFTPVDTDHDGIPDYRDKDSDNDHVPDYTEGWDTNADGYPDVLPLRQDRDRDGLDDAYDTFDRILNHYLLDAHNAISSAAPLPDFDHDGIRDWRDTDDDGDGIPTVDEDTNRDGNYANDDVDLDGHPEYLDTTNECELFVPEAFSPNGDGVHDYFQIYCIEVYPDAILYIFDRDGHLLYQHDHYGNMKYWGTEKQALWDGTSESRWVKKKGLLPPGNYLYVLVLGNGREEKGSVMISY